MAPSIIALTLTSLLLNLFDSSSCFSDEYYIAAVFEHARQDNFSTPQEVVQTNLAFYRTAAEVASSKGADIIILPEYGLFSPGDRDMIKNCFENTPNPKEVRANPCYELESYSDRPILLALSCMAKDFSIVIVANTGDIQKCETKECPDDGDFYFNTNVVFDIDGEIIGRYHKERLFFESSIDLPNIPQDPIFSTDFGKFGMFALNETPEIVIQVDAVLLLRMCTDPTPLMIWVQSWNALNFTTNVTLMAANTQLPGYSIFGSGIFNEDHGLSAYTHNTDGKSKLIVAKIPRLPILSETSSEWDITEITINSSKNYENNGSSVLDECSRKIQNKTTNTFSISGYQCPEGIAENYTFVKLNKPNDYLEACNNGICCSLEYDAADMKENYYLAVYNGTSNMFDQYFWCKQNCLLVRCEPSGDNPCATFSLESRTRFTRVVLTTNTTEYVSPILHFTGMSSSRYQDWNIYYYGNNPGIHFNGSSEILSVGLRMISFSESTAEGNITEIPINGSQNDGNDENKVFDECSRNILNETTDLLDEYKWVEPNILNNTFVKLNNSKDSLKVCNNVTCCSLEYDATDMEENYYFGVFNISYSVFHDHLWCEQNCLLVRYGAIGNSSCVTFPMKSRTRFTRLVLSGNITSEYVYPIFITDGISFSNHDEWNSYYYDNKPTINFNGSSELLAVGLYGACSDRDPPCV